MSLPSVPNPRDKVEIADGVSVEVRGLSYAEQLRLASIDGAERQSAFCIAQGAEVPLVDAEAWMETTPADAARVLVDKILELSGYGGEVNFQDDSPGSDNRAA